jgi:hypothetical protein
MAIRRLRPGALRMLGGLSDDGEDQWNRFSLHFGVFVALVIGARSAERQPLAS